MEVIKNENESDKIAQIDILRFEYGREKICKCEKNRYEIDVKNKLIYCRGCGAIKNPFDVCVELALRYEDINEQVKRCYRQMRELQSYKPFLREAKRLEEMMRKKDMLPICPKCGEMFNWNEINALGNVHYYKGKYRLLHNQKREDDKNE